MKLGNGRIIYDGVRETFHGKAALMEFVLQQKEARKDIAELLARNRGLREKIDCLLTPIKKGMVMSFHPDDKALELLFDTLYLGNTIRYFKGHDLDHVAFGKLITEGPLEVDLDGANLIAYAIVLNDHCRIRLHKEIADRGEYYKLWENSPYNHEAIEKYIPVQWIWDFRLILGLIVKLRQEFWDTKYFKG